MEVFMMYLMIDDAYETMPWDKIDTVVFDVGNVLLSFCPDKILETNFPGDTELHSKLTEIAFKSPYWTMLDRGLLTTEEAIEHICARHPEERDAVTKLMYGWIDLKDVCTENVEVLKQCKAMGKKTVVLSNYHKEPFAYIRKKYDFFNLFDDIVVSAHIGLLKPDLDIYKYVTDTYSLVPERTLFIDDTPMNIEAALRMGWQGFLYNKQGKSEKFFLRS